MDLNPTNKTKRVEHWPGKRAIPTELHKTVITYQVTTMLAASENKAFLDHNRPAKPGTDGPAL